jgi:acetyl-CoA decarbonylase/synthase complex subunit gamma
MALSGLEIYKLLPKTNCRECGFPTCLAFAMKLAAKQAELASCPHVSEEAQSKLAAASAPPIRLATIGTGEKKVEVGNETVLFRHEKTFFHQPGLFVRLKDTMSAADFEAAVERVASYEVERVGIPLWVDGFAIENASGDAASFAKLAGAAHAKTGRPIVLIVDEPAAASAALKELDGASPLISGATADNWEEMAKLAAEHKAALVVRGDGDLSALAELAEKIKASGVEDLVLDPGTRSTKDTLVKMTQLRRLALKSNFRPLGYPIITFPGEGADSEEAETVLAAQHIAKYAGVVVLDHFDPASAYPLLALRQNIFTDPQKPIQVSPGLYEINNPTADSSLLVTTNFSLTYFSVAGEVEGSGRPTLLLVADSEGMSVLTGWAAGKFDAEKIAKSVKQFDVASKVNHRKIVIPGLVSGISGELEEELPDWTILVGPREAIHIPSYLKDWS